MDWGYILLLGGTFGCFLILTQRMAPQHKRMTRGFIVTLGLITLFLVYPERQNESAVGLFIALLLSFLFWLLVGRYNPVQERDEIKVYGLDD
jgi:hypothetical protein